MNKILIAAGVFSAAVWIAVTFISLGVPVQACNVIKGITFSLLDGAIDNMHNGFHYDVANKDMPTVVFLLLFSVAFFVYFAVSLSLAKAKTNRNTFLAITFFAILFRLILLPSVAVHENDFYRYLWDGKVFNSGVNPYKYAPEDTAPELDKLREENPAYFNKIGHRHVPTIYPPFVQYIFALLSLVKEDSILAMKSIFVVFDLFVFLLIARLLHFFDRDPSLSIIYGWSPLVLKEITNSAHYDSVPIFLMLLFVYLIFKNKTSTGTVSLGFAALAKFFPLVLAPLYLKRIKWRNVILLAMMLPVFYIPFFLWGNTGAKGVFKGLIAYSQRWAYNGSVFTLLQAINNTGIIKAPASFIFLKSITAIIFIASLLYLSLKKDKGDISLLHKSFVAMTLLFLLSPVGNPWYFCWVIPFLCFFPYRSFITLSWLLIFSYLSFNHSYAPVTAGTLQLPFLIVVQYAPFFILFIIELFLKHRKKIAYV